VEIGEAGLLQMDRGVAGEVLGGEVEEGEVAEVSLVRVVGVAGARDSGGGQKVVTGEAEVDLGVGAIRHLEVKDDLAAAQAKIADIDCVAVRLLGFAERDRVRNFVVVLEETQVFEGGGGVRKELRIDDGAVLAWVGRSDDPLITEILRTGGLGARRSLPKEKC
jgi:hypothetical protein